MMIPVSVELLLWFAAVVVCLFLPPPRLGIVRCVLRVVDRAWLCAVRLGVLSEVSLLGVGAVSDAFSKKAKHRPAKQTDGKTLFPEL